MMSERSAGKAWTFEVSPNLTMCGKQSLLKGFSFQGHGEASIVNSSDDCCSVAYAKGIDAWSYDTEHKQCVIFQEVQGRIADPSSISGLGEAPQEGRCTIFSNIT